MEYRQLGRSGLMVPALTFGTGTFGGGTEKFKAWGAANVAEAYSYWRQRLFEERNPKPV